MWKNLVILKLSLGLHEIKWLVISMDDFLFSKDVMLPLATSLDTRVHQLVMGGVLVTVYESVSL